MESQGFPFSDETGKVDVGCHVLETDVGIWVVGAPMPAVAQEGSRGPVRNIEVLGQVAVVNGHEKPSGEYPSHLIVPPVRLQINLSLLALL